MISHEELREILHYDVNSGEMNWLMDRGSRAKRDAKAGYTHPDGYCRIIINKKEYLLHRLAWFWVTARWPKEQIDHKDGNRSNNAWDNLREASQYQNLANCRRRKTNTSGFKNVSWDKQKQKWSTYSRKNGKRIWIGFYNTPEDAHSAYMKFATDLYGEFARAQ